MEQMKPHLSLRGFITALLVFTAAGKGCDGPSPSAPLCFRRDNIQTMYICEWSSPYKSWNHTVYMRYSRNSIKEFKATWPEYTEIREEKLFQKSPADIWVEAHNGTSRCTSEKTSATLEDIIKYKNPQNVTVKWSQDNLTLHWVAPESYQAEVEIWHRRDSTQPWRNMSLARTNDPVNDKYDLTVVNLEKPSVQQFQMRQRSTQAKDLPWSDWSRILTVPIKFVRISKKLIDGSRRVTLRWKSITSSDGEAVSYQVEAFQRCPCNKHLNTTSHSNITVFGSYSAVDISVKANNSASFSPPARFHVPPENPPGLKVCEGTARTLKTKNVCREWYELQNGKVKEETVIISKSKKSNATKQNITQQLRDFLPYVYFEHSCTNNRLRTVKKCLYYKRQGKLDSAPQDFINPAGTPTTAVLSWEPIPTEKQQSFITHYLLCFALAGAMGPTDCHNISTSLRNYTLKVLTPGSKYNVSLKGVTSVGEGPPAQITINTQHEKPYSVWLSFGLLIGFFIFSILCTFVFTRIKNKVFPPVPVPVIMEFPVYQPEDQDSVERKEEADEVTLVQLHPECRPPDHTVKRRHLSGTPGEGSDLEEEEEEVDQSEEDRTPKDSTDQTTDLVQSEIALLIYRNGLVFDVNMDSS